MPNPLCTNPTNLRKRRGVPGGNLFRNVGLWCMSCEEISVYFSKKSSFTAYFMTTTCWTANWDWWYIQVVRVVSLNKRDCLSLSKFLTTLKNNCGMNYSISLTK